MKRDDLAVLVAAVAGGAIARALTHFVLGDVPHVMDEIAYLFQAKTFAAGHLSVPVPLPRAAFAMWFVDDRTAKFSIFPPGWPAVLAVGVKLGAPAWVNPILHALTVPAVAAVGQRLGGTTARVASAFAYALSPQALLLAASFMSHTSVALSAAVCLWAALRLTAERPPRGTAFLAGAALGLCATTRPLCAIAIALGTLAILLAGRLGWRRLGVHLAELAAPLVLMCALLGAYNKHLTGDATRFPQSAWFDEHIPPLDDPFFQYRPGCNNLGFGPGHGCDRGIRDATHDLRNALSNTGDNLTSWLWLAGGGPLLGFALLALRRARGASPSRLATAAVLVIVPLTVGLYALYWYAGTCYGARFYHAALPALMVCAVVGALNSLATRRRRIVFMAAWLAASAAGLALAVSEVSDEYWGTDNRFARFAQTYEGPQAIVMVAFKDDGVPMHHLHVTGFTSISPNSRWHNSTRVLGALGLNEPDLGGRLLFAKYHPALVGQLHDRFPERELLLYVAARNREADRVVPTSPPAVVPASPADNFDGWIVGASPGL